LPPVADCFPQEDGWLDGPAWAAKRLKEAQAGSSHPLGGASGAIKQTLAAFFGNGTDKLSGLVTDGLLNTGGLPHFGDKKAWELSGGTWRMKAVAEDIMSDEEERDAQAAKRFLWLSRVGSNLKLMKNYISYFKSTDSLMKYLQAVRVSVTHCAAQPVLVSRMHLQGLEINAMMLHKTFVKDFIGAVANLENLVFVQLQPVPKTGIADYTSRIRAMLTFSIKGVDMSPGALQNKATLLYSIAAFSLRDEVLSAQLATLAVQISAMARVLQEVIGLRFPALIKAHDLTEAFSKTYENLSPVAQKDARAKLKFDVADIFINVPTVTDVTTFDVPAIVSVGLSAAVVAGNLPTLVHYKDMFATASTLPADGPASLFAAALAMGLESSWFPQPTDGSS